MKELSKVLECSHNLANAPLKAAQAPLAMAKKIHCDRTLKALEPSCRRSALAEADDSDMGFEDDGLGGLDGLALVSPMC